MAYEWTPTTRRDIQAAMAELRRLRTAEAENRRLREENRQLRNELRAAQHAEPRHKRNE